MTHSTETIGTHKAIGVVLGYGADYVERNNAHNKYYRSKIYKQGKLVRVKIGHKATINHIY